MVEIMFTERVETWDLTPTIGALICPPIWLGFAHHALTPMNLHQSLQKSKDSTLTILDKIGYSHNNLCMDNQ